MTRSVPHRLPTWLLAVLATASACLVLTAQPVPAAEPATRPAAGPAVESASPSTPLRVSLETLAPGAIPEHGRVTLTGRITNRTQETWTDLNVYLLTSSTPLRTRAELADAAATEANAQVGARRTGPGLYDEVGDLAPGESVPYRLSVRRPDLGISGEPGVYWVGVHVLGASDEGRDSVADGRARTFMPLLPARGTPAAVRARTSLALLVPLKKPVQRASAGRLLDPGSWNDTLAPDGRLDRLLNLTARARAPITWLVDPAVLDAVRSVAQDNPSLDPAPAAGADPKGGPSGTPSGSSSAGPSGEPSGNADGSSADGAGEPSAEALQARSWLDELRRQAPTHTVAAVPYGDLDVAAALEEGMRTVYRQGVELSRQALAGYGIDAVSPVVAPSSGFLPESSLRQLDPGTPVVLDRAALPDYPRPVVRRDGVAPVVLTDADAEDGGPQPNSQYAALAVRQRLLSEGALHALSDDRDDPLVVSMPEYWNPGDAWASSGFFSGLDTPWLRLVDLPSVIAAAPIATPAEDRAAELVYPPSERAARIPLSNLLATRELTTTGRIFASLLTGKGPVDDLLARVAMLASSSTARAHPVLAREQAARTTGHVRELMSQVRVEGPPFVMMSGQSGPIQVTLVNGLQQSVTVGLNVSTPGSDLRIPDVAPVRLPPGRRTSIRLEARSDDIGVHPVVLTATNSDGVPVGVATQFSVRTSHVSTVIWVIMAIGAGLLFVAIAVRLFRRVRLRKASPGPRPAPEPDA